MTPSEDPYKALGLSASASEGEVRRAYRELVKLHHPDRNGGSPQAAARFAAVQSAYDELMRRRGSNAAHEAPAAASQKRAPKSEAPKSDIDARLAAMEREVAKSKSKSKSKRPAPPPPPKPSREELGYYDTDDSFTSILDDALAQASQRLKQRGGQSGAKTKLTQRLNDLFGG